jgi:hypothetical protein
VFIGALVARYIRSTTRKPAMRSFKTMLTVIGAVTVLVLAANTVAYAATGGKFILGKANKANKVSVLKRTTSGPALQLSTTPSGGAPMVVNGKGKVANLNADLVDGFDSSALKTTSYVFTKSIGVATFSFRTAIPVPAGKYLMTYSAYLNGADGGAVDCFLEQYPTSGPWVRSGESQFTAGAETPGLTGTGFMTRTSANTLDLVCWAANPFTTLSGEPIQIVATRVDTVAGSSAVSVAPGGARVGR